MASNKEFIEQIKELAKELGVDVSIEGLNNEKLRALVSDLKEKKKEVIEEPEITKAVEEPEITKAVEEVEIKKPPYYVMPGKSLTSKRGVLATERNSKEADYTEIRASDLAGGEDALNHFVKSGYIGRG